MGSHVFFQENAAICGIIGDCVFYAFCILCSVFILTPLATTPFLSFLFTEDSLQGLFILTIPSFSLDPDSDRLLPLLLTETAHIGVTGGHFIDQC